MSYSNDMSSNWNDLQYILAIYEKKSLVAAAKVLKVDETTVGRRLNALEQELGTKLFERKKGGFTPTPAGLKVLETAGPIRRQMLALRTRIEGQDQSLCGVVRVTLPESIATEMVIPRLPDFLALYPELRIELITSTSTVNVTKREADIAVRMFKPKAGNLFARKLGKLRFAFYVALSLRKDHATPHLIDYPASVSTEAEAAILKKLRKTHLSQILVNSRSAILAAVRSGLGMGMLPEIMLTPTDSSELRVVEAHAPIDLDVWLVVHSELKKNARIRVVADFLRSTIEIRLR